MSGKNFKPLFTWRSAVLQSDLPPTARHLALTLSTYMNEAGASVYPGADRLARDTGLSKVSVMKWRKALTDLGWLVLVRQGGSFYEGGRMANEYEAIIPANFASSWADAPPEFRDQKLGRKPTDQATTETGQGDLPVKESGPTGQPDGMAPVKEVDPTPQRPLPQLSRELSRELSTQEPRAAAELTDAESEPLSPPSDGDARGKAEGSGEESTKGPSEDAIRLATLICDRFQEHADRYGMGLKVRVTGQSIKDADLLLRRGPLSADENDRVIEAEPIPYERAERLVRFVFDNDDRDARGFCWAGQIRSGDGLRRNWIKAAAWANARRDALRNPQPSRHGISTAVPDDLVELTDSQLVELIRSEPARDDLARIAAEIQERLGCPDGQARRVASFRGLLGGKNWPRGGGGDVNKVRFGLAAWCDDWLQANSDAASTPALSRGA